MFQLVTSLHCKLLEHQNLSALKNIINFANFYTKVAYIYDDYQFTLALKITQCILGVVIPK